MAHLTRHELKKDEFRTTFEQFERAVKAHYKEIATVVGILALVVGSALLLKIRMDRQEGEATTQLGAALKTFRAYVGAPSAEQPVSESETFATAREKYQKALKQFAEIVRNFPRTKAAAIARYHQGVCQAQLGDQVAAIKSLREASRASDRAIASLAQLALASELAKGGKLEEARKLFQDLADHPTLTVPKATALLEMADTYRGTQPAQARQIYQQLERQFGSDATLAQAIKQQMASLP